MNMSELLKLWDELTPEEKREVDRIAKTFKPSAKVALNVIIWGATLQERVKVFDNATILANWDTVAKEVRKTTRKAVNEGSVDLLAFWEADAKWDRE